MATSMMSSAAALGPEIALLGGGLGTLLGGSFTPRTRQWRMRAVAGAAVLASLAVASFQLAGAPRRAFEGAFVVDQTTGLARLAVGVALLLVLALAGDEVGGESRESETYALLLLGGTGALLLAGGTDLALLVVAFLLSSVPLYGLIGMSPGPMAAEAALKTYLLGALFGILLMLGVILLAGTTGATSHDQVGPALADVHDAAVAGGGVLVLAGLLFKVGAFPGHFWVPDAAQGSTATAAAFLTTVPKIGGVVAIARLLQLLPDATRWAVLVGVVAVLSMTLGNLAAFFQDDPRRLLGWSTVSQVGYVLVPVAALGRSDLAAGAMLFYLAAYALTNVGAFAVAAALPEHRTLTAWTAVARSRPGLAAGLVVLLLGLLGTPPTAVFVGKLTAATAAWDARLAWLAVLLVLNTLLSLFYYLRWLAPLFRIRQAPDPGQDVDRPAVASASWPSATAYAAAGASLLLGLAAGLPWLLLENVRLG